MLNIYIPMLYIYYKCVCDECPCDFRDLAF